jgi:hypothetical protein
VAEIPIRLASFLAALDKLVGAGRTTIYVSGGSAVLLGYGGQEDTKDFDVVDRGGHPLESLKPSAGRDSQVHRATGYFLDIVPPIFPLALGFRERTVLLETGLEHLEVRLLEAHDLIVSKLLRMHPKDRRDVETLTRHETFSSVTLVERYRAAREELKFYWPDRVEKADLNFNAIVEEILGEEPIEWDEVVY